MAGYIKVAVRCRPFSKRELQNHCLCAISVDGSNITLSNDSTENSQSFTYDEVYWLDNPSQEKIMHDIGERILEESMAGFNSCLFAYGQTGTGKTHTIFGRSDDPGLVPWMVDRIFRERQQLLDQEVQLLAWFSCFQIYGDRVNDLLQLKDNSLLVRDHPIIGVHVPGALAVPCERSTDVHRLLAFGATRRAIAATQMNDQSSRSHVMVVIRLQRLEAQKPKPGETDAKCEIHARLNFFDLAGSERQSKATIGSRTFLEGCVLNTGLNVLNLLIRELVLLQSKCRGSADMKDAGIPYSASNLTFLMKDALAGNSKTRMVANISPSNDSLEDTVCTLRFARSVQTIKTVAMPNTETRSDMISSLQAELPELRAQLQRSGAALSCETLHLQVEQQERVISEMEEDFSAQVQRHRELDGERDILLQNFGLQALSFSKAAVHSNTETPYLINMADDPALAGILFFFLPQGKKVSIGSARDNSMRITGFGMSERMCIVENMDNHAVTIRKCSEEVRLSIDGQWIQAGVVQHLQHGQRIRLGRKMMLRLSIHSGMTLEAAKFSEEDLNLQPQDLEDEWEVHNSNIWLAVKDIVEIAAAEMTPDQAQLFCSEAVKAVQMADEATDITSFCRPHDEITFEVRIVSGPRPSVAIGVLKCSVQLYLWSISRMAERLDTMRDCCQMCMASCRHQINDLGDPWCELHPTAVQEHVALLEARLGDVQVHHEQMPQSAGSWILCRGFGSAHQRVLLVFISWHRAVLCRRKAKKDESSPPGSPQSKAGSDKRNAESRRISSPRATNSSRSKGESHRSAPNDRQSPLRSASTRGSKASPQQLSRNNAEPDLSNSKAGERTNERAGIRKKSSDGKAGSERPTRRLSAAAHRAKGRSMDKTASEVKPSGGAHEVSRESSATTSIDPPRMSSSEVPPSSSATASIELPVQSFHPEVRSNERSNGGTKARSVSPSGTPMAVSPAPCARLLAPEEVSLAWSPSPQPRVVAPEWSPSSYYRVLAPEDSLTSTRIISSGRSPFLQNRLVPNAETCEKTFFGLPTLSPSPQAPFRLIQAPPTEWIHPPLGRSAAVEGGSVSLTPKRLQSPAPQVRLREPESSPPRQARVITVESASRDWSPPPQARVISADEVKTRSQPLGSVMPAGMRTATPPTMAVGPGMSHTPRMPLQVTAPALTGPEPSSAAIHQRLTATASPLRTHTAQYITVPPMHRTAPALGSAGVTHSPMVMAVAPATTPPAPFWYAQLGPMIHDMTVSSAGSRPTPPRPSRTESQPSVLDERRPIMPNPA